MGLLFVNYLLKSRGVSVIYLGANVPVNDVEYVVKLKKPNYLFSHLTSVGHNFQLEKFINTITKKLVHVFVTLSVMLFFIFSIAKRKLSQRF